MYRVIENFDDGYEVFTTNIHDAVELFIVRAIEFSPDMTKFGTSGLCRELRVEKIATNVNFWQSGHTLVLAFADDGTFLCNAETEDIASSVFALHTTPPFQKLRFVGA